MASEFDPNDKHSWYFGPLSRDETNEIFDNVTVNGVFLVRESQSIRGDFVLCVREDNKISHYIVNRIQVGSSVMFRIGDQQFTDISALLSFYKTHYLDTTALTQPAPRQKVMTKYDFPGKDAEDLPFKKGEILEVISKDEESWWTARNKDGKTGQIPVPYVSKYDVNNVPLIDHHPTEPVVPEPKDPNPPPIHFPKQIPAKAIVIKPRIPSLYDKTQLRLTSYAIPREVPANAIVIHSRIPNRYQQGPEYPQQLKLTEGQVVKVTKMNDNGFWEGVNSEGETGTFPFRYVKFPEETETLEV